MSLASIPSPSDGVLDLGPLSVHVYGILLAVGVVVAAVITGTTLGAVGPRRGASSTTSSCGS